MIRNSGATFDKSAETHPFLSKPEVKLSQFSNPAVSVYRRVEVPIRGIFEDQRPTHQSSNQIYRILSYSAKMQRFGS